jgi:hypothetical protein
MLRSKADLKLHSVGADGNLDLVGTWVNELGSRMVIASASDDLISGDYWSKVSDEHKAVRGKLTGTVAGDTIGFVVNWRPTFDSVTSWSGKLLTTEQGYPYIYTLWQLSHEVGDRADWWESFLAGSDTFWHQDVGGQ